MATIKIPMAVITETSIKKEGVTVYRLGRLRTVRIDTGSAWCATLNTIDRPAKTQDFAGMIYNGSGYVNCIIQIYANGEVRISDPYGATISNAQYGYLRPKTVTYFVGD